jgi:hypothetical protein
MDTCHVAHQVWARGYRAYTLLRNEWLAHRTVRILTWLSYSMPTETTATSSNLATADHIWQLSCLWQRNKEEHSDRHTVAPMCLRI